MKLESHQIAEVYPDIEGDDFDDLVASVKDRGLINKIVVIDGRYILDGRQRNRACIAAKVAPETVEYKGKRDFASLVAFVRAANEHRRQLSHSQRAVVAFRLTKLGRKEIRLSAESEEKPDEKPAAGVLTQAQAAEALGISERTVERAAAVVQGGAAELVRAVEAGEVAVADAAEVVSLPKAKQVAALEKVRDGKAATLKEATTRRKHKPGREKLPAADRKAALKAFGVLRRALDKIGRADACRDALKHILTTIKE